LAASSTVIPALSRAHLMTSSETSTSKFVMAHPAPTGQAFYASTDTL